MDQTTTTTQAAATQLPTNTTTGEDQKWINFYERMANGDIPYNTSSYFVEGSSTTNQEGCGPIQLVTPTEQQIEMAKSQLKTNLKRAHSAARTPMRKRRKTTSSRSTSKTRKQCKRKSKNTKRKPPKKSRKLRKTYKKR